MLHKSKLLELIQWITVLTRPAKLHIAGFSLKMLKVSHTSLAPTLIWQNQYWKRYDEVAKKIHWLLCKKIELECNDKWHEHVPNSLLENEVCKFLWDLPDKVIEHRQLDIVCIDKTVKSCLIIDIAIPRDQNIFMKEQEKIDKHQDLQIELWKLWKLKAEVAPAVVSALGIMSHNLKFYLKKIDIPIITSCLQKTAILGTVFILRIVLGILEFR